MINEIKSPYIFKKIFNYILEKKVLLKIIKHNKLLQKKLDISINEYIECSNQIEIIIYPDKENLNTEINEFIYPNSKNSFCHIFFDKDKKEIDRYYLKRNEHISHIFHFICLKIR